MIGVIALARHRGAQLAAAHRFHSPNTRRARPRPSTRAVFAGCITRLRPIMLTAFGHHPRYFHHGLRSVFGGPRVADLGTFASTALTLLVISLVYFIYEKTP